MNRFASTKRGLERARRRLASVLWYQDGSDAHTSVLEAWSRVVARAVYARRSPTLRPACSTNSFAATFFSPSSLTRWTQTRLLPVATQKPASSTCDDATGLRPRFHPRLLAVVDLQRAPGVGGPCARLGIGASDQVVNLRRRVPTSRCAPAPSCTNPRRWPGFHPARYAPRRHPLTRSTASSMAATPIGYR